MSTAPPPYQYDPKADRRAAVLRAKAQRVAYKAQRNLNRQQTRHLRRGSILGPILLTVIGLAALLVCTGRWSALNFTSWYSRWWPALLVFSGVVLLAEWAFDQRRAQLTGQVGAAPLRRHLNAGVLIVLAFAIFLGATSRTVHDQHELFSNALSINHDNLFSIFTEKRDLPAETLDETLPPLTPGLVLSIENPHGDVNVTGKSNDGNLHITINKQVHATDATVQARGQELTPVFVASPNGISLTVPNVDGGSADLTVLMPESLVLTINATHGDINVTGVKAPLTLTSNHGDIELQSITGPVSAHVNRRDSSFSAHNITGDVTLKGNLDDVNLSDITGQTYMEGDFYGDSHFERLLGPVTFQSSKTHFTLARINGNVDISSEDISGSRIGGPVTLRVRNRTVTFDNLTGPLDLQDTDGTVDVTTTSPGNINIVNTNGPVNLTIPERTGFALTAQAASGNVENDFDLPTDKTGDHTTYNTTVGDGKVHLNLKTTHANITLRKGAPGTP